MLHSPNVIPLWVLLAAPILTQAAEPLGAGFTYQGEIQQNGAPVDGTVHLRFSLWDAATEGVQIGARQLLAHIPVSEGLVTVTLNGGGEFGPNAFDGDARWLLIEVCNSAACTTATVLAPRQPLTGSPYALKALSAPWSGLTGIPAGFADDVDNSGDSLWGENVSDIFYNAGRVGIGSDTPHHQLRISGGPLWTSNSWTGSIELNNGAAIGWQGNDQGQRFGIGQSTGGLWFFHTQSDPGTAGSPANYSLNLNETGGVGVGGAASITDRLAVSGGAFIGTAVFGSTLKGPNLSHVQFGAAGDWYIRSAASAGKVILQDSGGSVGIGTSSPIPTTKLYAITNEAGFQALRGDAPNGNGVVGTNQTTGLAATAGINYANQGIGVYGEANTGLIGRGVWGHANQGSGVYGTSNGNQGTDSGGVVGRNTAFDGAGVIGEALSGVGVWGRSEDSSGVKGEGLFGVAGYGRTAIYGSTTSETGEAGHFVGKVTVFGDMTVFGSFIEIDTLALSDHPVDPTTKYLSHSSVHSDDRMNIYSGNVVTDSSGYAYVELPNWFEAYNADFRYQLTVVDDADSHEFVLAKVIEKIRANRFTIRTSRPNIEVSWLVTGVRHDTYAKANPLDVEKVKSDEERGKYLLPELYGQPKENGIHYRPEMIRGIPADK